MKNQNNGKKTAVIAASAVGAVALLGAGALALFSDVSQTATGGTAGTVSVLVTNPDLQNKSNINPGDNDAEMWAPLYKEDERHYIPTSEDPLFDPKASHNEDDYSSYVTVATTPHDLTFTVANIGTKSIRTRQTFTISVYQVDKDDQGNTVANFLPANVFSLYEDGTYYGTKNQDILDVVDSTDYGTAVAPTNVYAERWLANRDSEDLDLADFEGADQDETLDGAKIKDAYELSVDDGMSQPWEEIAYKYYIDGDDNEWLVSVPNSDILHTLVGRGDDLPTADDVQEVPFGTLIKAVKYVVYSDIFDGVTDDNDDFAAEIEGAFGEKSNLGDENVNISVIPDAYHVQSVLMCDDKIVGAAQTTDNGDSRNGERVYQKDSNANVKFAIVDMATETTLGYVYYNAYKNMFIAADDMEMTGMNAGNQQVTVSAAAGEFLDGIDALATFDAVEADTIAMMWPVEITAEIEEAEADGDVDQLVFCDSLVDQDGAAIDGSERIPLVHAYNAKEYSYMLGFAKESTNKYQGATVTVGIVVEAMQYRNTDGLADWKAISTNTITTALDFTDTVDNHVQITVPEKDEEPMHEGELIGTGNAQEDALEADAYNETNKVEKNPQP